MTSLERLFGEQSRVHELEPIGVIDIGSNSVRLVVYEGAVRAPTPLFNEKVLCGLGRSIATTGKLGDDAVDRALAALARFRSIARILEVKNVRAFATAAVREAEDGAEFIARAEKACGMRIEVLVGEKEAKLVAQGIMMGFVEPDGIAGDLGGGSLELIDIASDRLEASLDAAGRRPAADRCDRQQDREGAAARSTRRSRRCPGSAQGAGRPFYAVGGSWRRYRAVCTWSRRTTRCTSRTAMRSRRSRRSPSASFCARPRSSAGFAGIEELARARREVLPYGALVLERLLKTLNPSEVVFSVFGIREGLIYSLLPAHERRKDPLLSFCAEYAGLRSRSVEHAWELCKWTDALFEPPGPKETPEERRLRYAACLISDIGWREHPDYRGEQSLNLLAHAGLSGIDHPGPRVHGPGRLLPPRGRQPGACRGAVRAAEGARIQARAEAGPHRRRGRAHRPYAVDRRRRRDRRDAA